MVGFHITENNEIELMEYDAGTTLADLAAELESFRQQPRISGPVNARAVANAAVMTYRYLVSISRYCLAYRTRIPDRLSVLY